MSEPTIPTVTRRRTPRGEDSYQIVKPPLPTREYQWAAVIRYPDGHLRYYHLHQKREHAEADLDARRRGIHLDSER